MADQLAAGRAGLAIARRGDLGKLMLRAAGDVARLTGETLGFGLPEAVNRATTDGRIRALRLGPDECILLGDRDALNEWRRTLDDALADRHRALVDISARLVAFEIEGPAVRDTLAAACPLDLHAQAFGPGHASRTVFGKAEIVLDCEAVDRFHLLTNRSFAPYLQALLAEAGREFGVASLERQEPSSAAGG